MTDLPLLGAALTTAHLETTQDFILSEDRDLEIQVGLQQPRQFREPLGL